MADLKSLDVGDWIGILGLAGGALAAITAMIRRYINNVKVRIDLLEADMKEWDKLHAEHNTQLAVVKNCQENTRVTLDDLKETTKDTNDKVSQLSETVMKVLLAVQAKANQGGA